MIELLIVVGIGAILAAIAVPSLRDTLNNTRQSSALGLLINDLNQARGEAIKRNARVVLCVRNTAGTDCETAGAGTDWKAGWLVCIAVAGADTCAAATAAIPNPVVVRPALEPTLALTSTVRAVRFNPNSSASAATLALAGNWAGATTRNVTVAVTGNITK
jgi:type IV fimbrial biogenesis protein FimT